MNILRRKGVLTPILIVVLSFMLLSCSDDSTGSIDNSIEGSDGVGVRSLEVQLPPIARLVVVSEVTDSIIIEMDGVDDLQTYEIYANIKYEDGVVSLSSSDESLATLPHQEYYINFVKFPSDDESLVRSSTIDDRSVTLGAKLSLSDPNDISILSTYNEDEDCFGLGTEDEPFSIVTIKCLEQHILEELTQSDVAEHLKDVHFRQTRSINFALEYELFESWTAAGKFNIHGLDVAFCGVYDGARKTIEDMQIASSSSAALFYRLGDGAVIKNVKMSGVDISGGLYSGAIACLSSGDVTLQNIDVSGSVSGHGSVGGMIGCGAANFIDCYSQINISDNAEQLTNDVIDLSYSMGGFIGYVTGDTSFDVCAYSGSILNSYGTYSGGGYIGSTNAAADAGGSLSVSFNDCAVKGDIGDYITSSFDYVGGLIGFVGSDVDVDVNNVTIGSQFTMLTSDDNSDAIFGDDPEVSVAELILESLDYAGGYFGNLYGAGDVSFAGHNTYVSEMVDICSNIVGGVIGGGASDISITDRIYVNASISTLGDDPIIGGFAGKLSDATITGENTPTISNDPQAMTLFNATLGSFVGYCSSCTFSGFNFINYYSDLDEFVGYYDSNTDMSGATFTNY